MPDLNPLHWGKKKDDPTVELGVIGNLLQGSAGQTTSEIEMQQNLGTNFHMTESQELMATLKALACRPVKINVDNGDGSTRVEERVWYHPVFTALYIEVNRLHSMRFLDPPDAAISFWQTKYNFKKLKMKLSYQEYDSWGGVVDALERMALEEISDSRGGRKAKLLKVTPKTFEVQFHKTQGNNPQSERGFMP